MSNDNYRGELILSIDDPEGPGASLHKGEHALTIGRKYDDYKSESHTAFLSDAEFFQLWFALYERAKSRGLF